MLITDFPCTSGKMNIECSSCSFIIYYVCSVFNFLEFKEFPEFLNVANNTGIRIEISGIIIIKREDFFHMGDNFLLFIFLRNNKISVIKDSAFQGIFLLSNEKLRISNYGDQCRKTVQKTNEKSSTGVLTRKTESISPHTWHEMKKNCDIRVKNIMDLFNEMYCYMYRTQMQGTDKSV